MSIKSFKTCKQVVRFFFYLEIRAKTESRLIAMKVNRLLKSKVHGPPLNPADEET